MALLIRGSVASLEGHRQPAVTYLERSEAEDANAVRRRPGAGADCQRTGLGRIARVVDPTRIFDMLAGQERAQHRASGVPQSIRYYLSVQRERGELLPSRQCEGPQWCRRLSHVKTLPEHPEKCEPRTQQKPAAWFRHRHIRTRHIRALQASPVACLRYAVLRAAFWMLHERFNSIWNHVNGAWVDHAYNNWLE